MLNFWSALYRAKTTNSYDIYNFSSLGSDASSPIREELWIKSAAKDTITYPRTREFLVARVKSRWHDVVAIDVPERVRRSYWRGCELSFPFPPSIVPNVFAIRARRDAQRVQPRQSRSTGTSTRVDLYRRGPHRSTAKIPRPALMQIPR